jgi:hypothetical protein
MCNHENREAAMTVIDKGTPERLGRDGIWCDPCLEPLVRALNAGGIRTVASCCGHGSYPGSVVLQDERVLMILPGVEALLPVSASPAQPKGF